MATGLALLVAGAAQAQDNLEQGKTAAQLFASDCAICHKSPQGLAKGGGLFGVQSFLREHYTTSKESAAAMAAYLEGVDRAAGSAPRQAPPKRGARGDGKPGAKKPSNAATEKPSDGKTAEPKASEPEVKPIEPKSSESKPSETKPAEAPKGEKSE